MEGASAAWFSDFRYFEPREEGKDETFPYFALLKVDGDRMGEVLARGEEQVQGGRVEDLHRAVSSALADFADSLRTWNASLNLTALDRYEPAGKTPQLIYAGGDDVLVVCDPRDALPLAQRLQEKYEAALGPLRAMLVGDGVSAFTLSGAALFAHTKHPAGLLLQDLETLLKRKAKGEAGRNALAVRLAKRGGVPVEVAFKWNELSDFRRLIHQLREGELSSKLSYHLREDEKVLAEVFDSAERWVGWLADRIGRGGVGVEAAREAASLMAPLFRSGRSQALRIARFLAVEVREWPEKEEVVAATAGAGGGVP
ncbi:MAG: Cas10/Cmr2 second palm domain-containing protein [Thermoanaerobaculia bacterium]